MQTNVTSGLNNLVAPKGARKKPKRVGRGESSGHGKTCGRGHKGQKSRKSGHVRPGFEGGQNPLARRLPKRGFNNSKFAQDVRAINLGLVGERFKSGAVVDQGALMAAGLVGKNQKIKILADGEIEQGLTFRVHAMSKTAAEKIKEKGGTVELIG